MGSSPYEEIAERLRRQMRDVRRLTADLGEAQLRTRTIAGKWSVNELVCHLQRVQELLADRISAMLAEDMPRFEKYAPDDDPEFASLTERPFSETLAAFEEDRSRLIEGLEGLTEPEWHRPGHHPSFPFFDVYFQAEYLAHHEAHHVFQIFERRSGFGRVPL